MNGKTSSKKGLTMIAVFCYFSLLIMAIIQLTGIWDKAVNVTVPLLGVIMLIQANVNWRKNRMIAVGSLCIALFFLIASIVKLF